MLKLSFPQGEMRVYPLRDGEEAWRFSRRTGSSRIWWRLFNQMELVGPTPYRRNGGLTGRNACGVHQHLDFAVFLPLGNQIPDGFPAGKVHFHGDHVKARLVHRLCNGLGVGQFLVADHDFHPRAHPAGDGHADLPGTGPKHDVFHFRTSCTHFRTAALAPSTLLP